MGLLSNLKLFGRKREPVAITGGKTTNGALQEGEETTCLTIEKPSSYSNSRAECELPSLLWDAAHSPEVLSIKTSLLRDPTPSMPVRPLSSASSTVVASSAPNSPTVAQVTKRLRLPSKLCERDFEYLSPLRSGDLVRHAQTGREFVMNCVAKHNTPKDRVLNAQSVLKDAATRGVANIVDFVGSFHNEEFFYFLTAHNPQGDLDDLINRYGRNGLPKPLVRFYSAELACGIKYLHDMGVVHRDINTRNILLSESQHIVLSGFEHARSSVAPIGPVAPTWTRLCYMAPEIFSGDFYAPSTDVWAFAVTVFAMITGKTPWQTGEPAYHIRNLMTPFEAWLDDERRMGRKSRSFMKMLFTKDPKWRVTITEAMDHHWWGKTDWKAIAAGTAPLPDVGLPPFKYSPPRPDAEYFSYRRYANELRVDTHPEFFYASPALEYDADAPAPERVTRRDAALLYKSPFAVPVTPPTGDKSEYDMWDIEPIEKPTGFFSRVKSWLGAVASGISRLCKRISLL